MKKINSKKKNFSLKLIDRLANMMLSTKKNLKEIKIYPIYNWNFKGIKIIFISYDKEKCYEDFLQRDSKMTKEDIELSVNQVINIFKLISERLKIENFNIDIILHS